MESVEDEGLSSIRRLILAYREAGRLAEAIELYQSTLADRVWILGPDHPDTLRTKQAISELQDSDKH